MENGVLFLYKCRKRREEEMYVNGFDEIKVWSWFWFGLMVGGW